MAPKSTYKSEYHDRWAWSLAIKGATDKDIADAFEMSVRQINRWKTDHESFKTALTEGKNIADANVERSLYERAIGIQYDEVEKIIENDNTGKPNLTKTTVRTKKIPPDTLAAMYWLNNRKKNDWSRVPEETTDEKESRKELVKLWIDAVKGASENESKIK